MLLTCIYLLDDPIGLPSGGSILGYAYGGIATAGILYLMYYGMRKRSYFSSRTTLLGILSAHSWIGISLLLIVPLHSAFSFGLNIHTLAYLLLCSVVFSGIWGSYLYLKLPQQLSSQRGGSKIKDLLAQLKTIENEIKKKSEKIAKEQLEQIPELKQIGVLPSIIKSCFAPSETINYKERYAKILSECDEAGQEKMLYFITLFAKRAEILSKLKSEVRIQTMLRLWLYLHLPLSFAMLAAVAIHIFCVFYNW